MQLKGKHFNSFYQNQSRVALTSMVTITTVVNIVSEVLPNAMRHDIENFIYTY